MFGLRAGAFQHRNTAYFGSTGESRRPWRWMSRTATPHDGSEHSFASLCELLDPSLVDAQGHHVHALFCRRASRKATHSADNGLPVFLNSAL